MDGCAARWVSWVMGSSRPCQRNTVEASRRRSSKCAQMSTKRPLNLPNLEPLSSPRRAPSMSNPWATGTGASVLSGVVQLGELDRVVSLAHATGHLTAAQRAQCFFVSSPPSPLFDWKLRIPVCVCARACVRADALCSSCRSRPHCCSRTPARGCLCVCCQRGAGATRPNRLRHPDGDGCPPPTLQGCFIHRPVPTT